MVVRMGDTPKKKAVKPVVAVPDCPENLYLTKDEFVKRRKAMNEARKKAEEAYNKEMSSQLGGNAVFEAELKAADNEVRKDKQLVVTLKDQLVEFEKELKESPESEHKDIKKNITKVKNKIKEAENELEESKTAYETIKASQVA